MSENPYVREAKRRWPKYRIGGAGPFALVNTSLTYVELFEIPLMAQAELDARTDAAFCSLFELKPASLVRNANVLRVTAETIEHRR